MNNVKKFGVFLLPVFVFNWILTTVLVDFIAIPTAFRALQDVRLGGIVGMALFPKVNILEFVLAMGLLISIFVAMDLKSRVVDRIILALAFFLVLLVGVYLFYLTPTLEKLTVDLNNYAPGTQAHALVSVEHQFFHQLFVQLYV